jgi:hypothetical protein
MGVLVLRKETRRKLTSSLLLLSFVLSGFLTPLNSAWAAQVSIDTLAVATGARQDIMGSSVVFTTDQIGYKFYVDSTNFCVYSKTTDGGTSWGAAVTVNSATTCFGVVVWYDRWTPGDTGNLIHIASAETTGTDEVWYNNLDVTTDTRLNTTTGINGSSGSGQGVGATIAGGANAVSITKGTDGTLYMSMNDSTDSYVVECSTNCGVNTSWTETGTNPMDLIDEFSMLVPLSAGDILIINRDNSADDLRSKVWDDSAGSWSGSWTNIDNSAFETALYDPGFSAAVHPITGDIYLAYADTQNGTVGGSNDDIRTAIYSGGAWTAKTDVLTNVVATPAGITEVTIGIDAYNDDVYVGYIGQTPIGVANSRTYWKSSTDGMTTWGGQQGPVDTVGAESKFGLSLNMTGEERMYITWFGLTSVDIMGDTIADIAPTTILTTQGTQKTQLRASTTDQYVGGSFAITETSTTRDVTSVEINETGTVDGTTDVDNIELWYETDTSAPYNCASEAFGTGGAETQYGTTDTNGFSAANGNSVFTDTVSITTTQAMCMYVVLDVMQSANTKTIELEVTQATTDVLLSTNIITPLLTYVALAGATSVVDSNLTQTHYHWRNDNGNETAATSRTNSTENTSSNIQQDTPVRLRIGVSNSTGATTSLAVNYRLEYAINPSTCDVASGWTDVNATADAWDMYNSSFITNGDDTTNITPVSGGVTNVGTTFLTPNGGQLDTTSQTGNITLTNTQYTELEYTIVPDTAIPENTNYCFRVTSSGNALPVYTNYPQATVKLSNDFKVQRGFSTIAAAASTITITAGTDYEAPSATSSAFIRITNTQLTGAGRSTGAGNSNASNVAAHISNPDNLLTSITFTRTGVTDNTRISWEIVEYKGVAGGENEMKVRKTEVLTYAGGGATVNGTVLANVTDDADVVAFITGQGNPNANRTAYVSGISTSAWDSTNDRAVLTRAATTGAVPASVAVVEFTGTNWKVQRSEHTYTGVGSTETNSITAVNSLTRTHANLGHEVWLSGLGQISFLLDGAATTPGGQTSVAWVIENTQTTGGTPMDVTRSNSTLDNIGSSPETNNISIGKTLNDLSIASIFVNNRSDTALTTWPEPIIAARIISTTQYELWRSDITANLNYRTEIVEWPTAVRKLEQEGFWLFVDNDDLLPADIWPAGGADLGENTDMTANDVPTTVGDKVRIRMSVKVTGASMAATADSFKLQYGRRTTPSCAAVSVWQNLGDIGSTTAAWRGVANTPADGTTLSTTDPPTGGDLVLTGATVAGTYEEQNNSANNPYVAFPNDIVEYDWVVQHHDAEDKSSYCFRMTEDDGTVFTDYNTYPVIRTIGYEPLITNWRWYDDETNATPSTPLTISENIAPSNIENQNALKLRVVLQESSGADGVDVKFALQYSEYADFSQGVHTLTATTTCVENSLWCYYNGAGVDNAVINSAVISNADSCVAGVGDGCGTHNEGISTTTATQDQVALTNTEYEFTLLHAGARVNAVYYFRMYNVTYEEAVGVADTFSYPSLVTEGATLTFSIGGVDNLTSVAGIVTDATTTPTTIALGALPLNSEIEAAQSISIDTNATQGYQVLSYAGSQLLNVYNDPVPPVAATNATPAGWNTACTVLAIGCFGYHTTDGTLEGGSARFAATDSYAALDTTPREIMYSSTSTNETYDIVYKVKVTEAQPAGDYSTDIVYIAVPVH